MENTQKLKTTFFRKFIVSIFGIDKYDKISESTVSSFIGYIILLSVLVTLILTPAITRTEVGAMEVFKNFTQSNLPDFKVVDDKFEVDSEEPIIRTNKTDFDKMFDGTIILTNYANVEKEHKDLGVWILLDDPDLKKMMTKTLRRYFNALRSDEKHIKNVENYLFGTMQNLFGVWWNQQAAREYAAKHPEEQNLGSERAWN